MVVFWSRNARDRGLGFDVDRLPENLLRRKRVIPILVDGFSDDLPAKFYEIVPVDLDNPNLVKLLLKGVQVRSEQQGVSFSATVTPLAGAFRILSARIENIRCFQSFEMSFAPDGEPALHTLMFGDNAAGKSTLLRCLALALNNESDAAALMKELPGPMIREGESEGGIHVELSGYKPDEKYTVNLAVSKTNGSERLRQTTEPPESFPWTDCLCAATGHNVRRSHLPVTRPTPPGKRSKHCSATMDLCRIRNW